MTTPTPASAAPAAAGRMVVGVDGSPSSIQALRWAARIAPSVGGAGLDAVIAWQSLPSYSQAVGMAGINEAGDYQKILDSAVETAFGDTRPADLRTWVLEGHPAQVLVEKTREPDVQMLVVGSRGHGGFVGLLIGSTSAYCAEHATCPVLIVHATPEDTQ